MIIQEIRWHKLVWVLKLDYCDCNLSKWNWFNCVLSLDYDDILWYYDPLTGIFYEFLSTKQYLWVWQQRFWAVLRNVTGGTCTSCTTLDNCKAVKCFNNSSWTAAGGDFKGCFTMIHATYSTLWLFNIAMENGQFIDGLPIKNYDFPWVC